MRHSGSRWHSTQPCPLVIEGFWESLERIPPLSCPSHSDCSSLRETLRYYRYLSAYHMNRLGWRDRRKYDVGHLQGANHANALEHRCASLQAQGLEEGLNLFLGDIWWQISQHQLWKEGGGHHHESTYSVWFFGDFGLSYGWLRLVIGLLLVLTVVSVIVGRWLVIALCWWF